MSKLEKFLKFTAEVSEKLAVKSCGATSFFDAHQPKMPEALKKLKK